MKVINTDFELGDENFYNIKTKKTQIVLGHSYSSGSKNIKKWMYRNGGKYKKTPTFSIDIQGRIQQHFDPKYYSNYLNISRDEDKNIISIELVNEGWLYRDNVNNKYINWIGDIYNRKSDVVERRWRGHTYWAPYSDKQIKASLDLIKHLCEEFNIPKKFVGHNVKLDGLNKFEGIACRANYFSERTDLSPAFDFEYITNNILKK